MRGSRSQVGSRAGEPSVVDHGPDPKPLFGNSSDDGHLALDGITSARLYFGVGRQQIQQLVREALFHALPNFDLIVHDQKIKQVIL
jgi:hypothetical protein